jgi:hypothetical protein
MRSVLSFFFSILILSLSAQKISLDQLKNWEPRTIGPSGMSGRVTAIDVVINQPDTWYIGAASGGVWKTENAGANWMPIFDEQSTLNIGSIAIQQSNPNVIWVGTGEGNPRNSQQYRTQIQSNDYWLGGLSNAWIDRNDPNGILDYEKRVDAVTVDQVKKAAIKFLDLNNYVKAVLYPENTKTNDAVKPAKAF